MLDHAPADISPTGNSSGLRSEVEIDTDQQIDVLSGSSSTHFNVRTNESNHAVKPQMVRQDSAPFERHASAGSNLSSASSDTSSTKRLTKIKPGEVNTVCRWHLPRVSAVKSLFSISEMDPAVQRPQDVGTFSDSDSSEDDSGKQRRKLRRFSGLPYFSEADLERVQQRVMEHLGIELERSPEAPREPWHMQVQRSLGILHMRVYIAVKQIKVEFEPPYYPSARHIVSSFWFELCIAVLVIINAAILGLGTMFDDDGRSWAFDLSEYVFTLIFLMEFILRIMSYSWAWMFDLMNMFDTFIVWVAGVLITFILAPLGSDLEIVRLFTALRVLRLARLVRIFRMQTWVQVLWFLVRGVAGCMQLLLWGGILLGIVHYMFAVAFIEMLAKREEFEEDEVVQTFFGSLMPAMFTLFQLMTFSSWAALIRPILFRTPATSALFFLWIGVAGLVLRNLFTAIVVTNAFEAIDGDEEAQALTKQAEDLKLQVELREIFESLDEDRSGLLSLEEFTDSLGEPKFVRRMKMLDLDLDELPDIFSILDDRDGHVSVEEFCEGFARMQGPAKSRDLLYLRQQLRRLNGGSTKIEKTLLGFAGTGLCRIEEALDCSHEHFLKMHMLTTDILLRINDLGIRKVVQISTMELPALREPTSDELAREVPTVQLLTGATDMAGSVPACLNSIPPAWIAHRREEARKRQKNEPRTARKRELVQHVLREGEGTVDGVLAGEWDNLQVSRSALPLMNRVIKPTNDSAHAKAIVLPSMLVQRPATPSTPPALLLDGDRMPAKKPNSAPKQRNLSLM